MPIKLFGLPEGYELRRNYRGRFYVLLEIKSRELIIAEFPVRPSLARLLDEIESWETLRENVRGEGPEKEENE